MPSRIEGVVNAPPCPPDVEWLTTERRSRSPTDLDRGVVRTLGRRGLPAQPS